MILLMRVWLLGVVYGGVVFLLVGCGGRVLPAWEEAGAKPMGEPRGELIRAVRSDEDAKPEEVGGALGKTQVYSMGVTAMGSSRGEIENVGLQLPRVSPDGKWIAYLVNGADWDHVAGVEKARDELAVDLAVDFDQLVTGRGLDAVGLAVRPIGGGEATLVAKRGACWPVWFGDSEQLLFVSYDQVNGCALGIYDVKTGTVQRKAVGLRHMLMPAVSGDGKKVAVVGYGELADDANVFVVDLATGQVQAGPHDKDRSNGDAGKDEVGVAGEKAQEKKQGNSWKVAGETAIYPRWVGDEDLLFLRLNKGNEKAEGWLMRWQIGAREARRVGAIKLPSSIYDAQHCHAGILEALSPNLGWYAYYDVISDEMVLQHLMGEDEITAGAEMRSGAWWDDDWLVAANDREVMLVSTTERVKEGGRALTLRLLRGQWAVLWADRSEQSVILVGPSGNSGDKFAILQLWLVLSGR